ncbi:aspartate/glutamate racemase family protein [Evansella cellulosilytica]|uniref:Aspartate/glutamate racemase family protein n=1 Tax=Evansella cellulosilytica (strain ATCC 21833 / DSM 2522 / FERM P-1141 / JCM 9156 / N-4) TaxID=649639 RepID=E6TXI3_EVAC2|nr:aspartate/glutamate racemase family protein [Evansella cellulosilytica]ADU28797.1 hypothetical protein Bcell_0515 [Evansella cellulosilytica DSM 2522]
MIFQAQKGQVYYGHKIGILMLDTFIPLIPGDVGNATTYDYPVLYRTLHKITAHKMVNKAPGVLEEIISKGKELVDNGAEAITGGCGFLLLYQDELRKALNVPVFLSSLLQIPFMLLMLNTNEKVGLITADSSLLKASLLREIGIAEIDRVEIVGLEKTEHFRECCMNESGTLNSDVLEAEVVTTAEKMVHTNPNIKSILLECSLLPPYAKAVQEAVHLPVFDYVTMINYVQASLNKTNFSGFL